MTGADRSDGGDDSEPMKTRGMKRYGSTPTYGNMWDFMHTEVCCPVKLIVILLQIKYVTSVKPW